MKNGIEITLTKGLAMMNPYFAAAVASNVEYAEENLRPIGEQGLKE
jgi:hypothetical protein